MRSSQRLEEMEFELALVGVLEDMYGINVRVQGDPLNRRLKGYATLEFGYFYSEGGVEDPEADEEVKVVVSVQGVPGASFSFTADLQGPDSVMHAADDCENLALAIRQHLAGEPSPGDEVIDRRWTD